MGLKGNIKAMMMGMAHGQPQQQPGGTGDQIGAARPSAKQPGATTTQHATPKGTGDAHAHFTAAASAHKAGDHAGARKYAFRGIRAIDSNAGAGSAANGGTGDTSANTTVKTAGANAAFPPAPR